MPNLPRGYLPVSDEGVPAGNRGDNCEATTKQYEIVNANGNLFYECGLADLKL